MKRLIKIYSNIFIRYSKIFSRKNLYKFLKDAVKEYCKRESLSILNIGAGGEISKILKKQGLKFKEIDIDPEKKPDYILDIENIYIIKNNSIDIIFCLDVLEHVKNPFNAIEEIKRILKKGGLFIGSTPFMIPIHEEPYDFYRFTKYGIINLFKNFRCLELKERNNYAETIYVLFVRLYNVGNILQRIIAVLLTPLFIILLPLFFILRFVITNKQATTGYFYIFKNE